MKATFIGIDLAWQSEQNPSGGAVLRGDRAGARLQVLWTIYSIEAVSEFVRSYATSNTVVAIDAPLIILNETGQRACETAVGKRYGSRDASCHTSNLTLYRDAPSVALTKKLLRRGFAHVDRDKESSGRLLAEVYTHAAMVALFDLKKTIKYKKGPIAVRKAGLNKLRNYLRQLRDAEPPLLSTSLLREFLSNDLKELKGTALKNYEDQVDGLFCAYLAYYFWYWGWERNELFGDVHSGYILNPKLQSDIIASTAAQPTYQEAEFFAAQSSKLKDPSSTAQNSVVDYTDIINQAHALARPIRTSDSCTAADVGSVIVSRSGKTYTGVCLDFSGSLGFCAEHAAIAEMLKVHESEIALVVAVDEHGNVLPPCGRCREMMWQLNPSNRDALVILAPNRSRPLHELLPER